MLVAETLSKDAVEQTNGVLVASVHAQNDGWHGIDDRLNPHAAGFIGVELLARGKHALSRGEFGLGVVEIQLVCCLYDAKGVMPLGRFWSVHAVAFRKPRNPISEFCFW